MFPANSWLQVFSDLFYVYNTALQYMMISIVIQQRLWPCHQNGSIKTIQTITQNLYASSKLDLNERGISLEPSW